MDPLFVLAAAGFAFGLGLSALCYIIVDAVCGLFSSEGEAQ